ncbi:MAG: hypothetical protein GF408_06765 [Candidatus Omnitrophica bacterium]|nr:hypothetical protein [Candidatus Omnitrophota bacterium]
MEKISSLQNKLIFKAGEIASSIGLNKSMGQIYAALYLEKKKMTLNDISEVCRMSKGNISINIRRLEKWGAVEKVWGNEKRKDYYQANRDIAGFAFEHIIAAFSDLLERSRESVREAQIELKKLSSPSLSAEEEKKAALYGKSLGEFEEILGRVEKLMENARRIKKMINE